MPVIRATTNEQPFMPIKSQRIKMGSSVPQQRVQPDGFPGAGGPPDAQPGAQPDGMGQDPAQQGAGNQEILREFLKSLQAGGQQAPRQMPQQQNRFKLPPGVGGAVSKYMGQ